MQEQKLADMRNRTLGTLVGAFTGNHPTAASSDADTDAGPDDGASSGGQSVSVAWASMRFNISMSPERYAQTKDGLAELVALRNDLVHHLIERLTFPMTMAAAQPSLTSMLATSKLRGILNALRAGQRA